MLTIVDLKIDKNRGGIFIYFDLLILRSIFQKKEIMACDH